MGKELEISTQPRKAGWWSTELVREREGREPQQGEDFMEKMIKELVLREEKECRTNGQRRLNR